MKQSDHGQIGVASDSIPQCQRAITREFLEQTLGQFFDAIVWFARSVESILDGTLDGRTVDDHRLMTWRFGDRAVAWVDDDCGDTA